MALMARGNFKKQLQLGLNTVFGMEYKAKPEQWPEIFAIENSVKAYEEDVLMTGLGGARVKAEGAGVAYDAGYEAWTSRYIHETIALAFAITEEAEEDGLYGSLGSKYARALARSLKYTKEVKGAAILNNAFDTTYKGGDDKSLLATDHPLAGGGSFGNRPTTDCDLSEAAIEDACIAINNFVDDRGIPCQIQARKLVLPTSLEFVATRILRSTNRVGTTDNDTNAIRVQGSIPEGFALNNYLVDTDAWFIITDAMDGLKHMVRRRVSRGVEGDFETGNMRYKARERYVFGWTDPRGIYGSSGA